MKNDDMKKAIRYLRFSSDDQSHHSIERQELVTGSWLKSNEILLTDTFIDKGYSAKTFDRPDVKMLFSFIKKNHRQIDYLVVSELTRFSRDTGAAINMVKEIQTTYGIRIVSASRSQVYDVYESNSFFLMGLEFLLGNTENIKRTTDINGGIYTAKAIKGKYIHGGPAPYGYIKEGTGEQRKLIINEEQAAVIRYIFDEYLKEIPVYIIRQQARQMGFTKQGSSCIQEVLANPLYISYQYVKPLGKEPGGLFAIKDLPPIIDGTTWHKVQEKIKSPKYKKTLSDDLPLRGFLRCWCKTRLSGAPSTNRIGKKYLYYKCPQSKHLNLSATKAHDQLQEILHLLSLPIEMLEAIADETVPLMKEREAANKKLLQQSKTELQKIEQDLFSVERKFISEGSITPDTYHRWHEQLSSRRIEAGAAVEKYSRDIAADWWMLSQQLEKLTDMQYLYNHISTPDKQEVLKQVFDDGLYYQNSTYRTHYLIESFTHNLLTLKTKQLLILDGWDYSQASSPVVWTPPSHNRTLHDLLFFLSTIKAA